MYAVADSGTSAFGIIFMLVGLLLAIIGFLIGAAIYFVPSIVAKVRKHDNFVAILLLNIFLGWTFIGWVVCIVWAATKSSTQTTTQNVYVTSAAPQQPAQPQQPQQVEAKPVQQVEAQVEAKVEEKAEEKPDADSETTAE
jgi:hypothetical protein